MLTKFKYHYLPPLCEADAVPGRGVQWRLCCIVPVIQPVGIHSEIKVNLTIALGVFSLTLVLLLVALLLMRSRRREKRTNLLLAKKNSEIESQKVELLALTQTQTRLFSILGHDLRGPVGAIQSMLELISDEKLQQDAATVQRLLETLRTSAGATFNLLENLLYWARVHEGSMKPTIETGNLSILLAENIQLAQSAALLKNLTLEAAFPERLQACFDYHMINLTIRNLLTNAIKFTPENGQVSVKADQAGDFITISVCDTGIGIKAEKIHRILNGEMYFLEKGVGNESGTGLGLLLCQDFLEFHNTVLTIESEPGKGSCFSFRLTKSERAHP